MAGLMNPTGAPPAAGPDPMSPAAAPADAPADDRVGDDEGTEQASPEEQAQYDKFVKLGRSLIGDKGDNILDLLDQDPADLRAVLGDIEQLKHPTPPLALAATAVIVVLEAIRRMGDEKPSDDVILHGGKELMETIADLGTKAGVHDYTQDEMNQAWLMANDLYRETATQQGMVDTNALKQQFDQLVSADKEGKLGDVLPALANAKVQEQPAQDDPQQPADPATTGG